MPCPTIPSGRPKFWRGRRANFLDEGLLIGNPAVEALGRQDAEFGLCQIKPTAVHTASAILLSERNQSFPHPAHRTGQADFPHPAQSSGPRQRIDPADECRKVQ